MAVTIETELSEWLREAFGVEVESVFDLTSASTLISFRNMIASNEVAKRIDAESDGRFDHALKLYIDFLDSKFNPLKKKPKAMKDSTTIWTAIFFVITRYRGWLYVGNQILIDVNRTTIVLDIASRCLATQTLTRCPYVGSLVFAP